ncbi:putative 2-aminoethylphosphonate ABC transporter ATP-binding protein [Bartonella tamiae]|uniref:ABC transporter domain-containing protein n=1 Tax=Bartonella tamiae Th239 TaxID=1094558 RepID=J1JVM3_9HYPH|nr:putative 2-aminoethylphosphonate ABC transporter ATP-binding protein [Bartonella tamiae]EJF89007.1 hypothetical protein ME5_01558 [Bartonella tamiae Th239]EJF94743.1 hypothetical protein MEG_00324 [Bartonella tamiae Th307]
MTTPHIVIDHAMKRFKNFIALNDVSLSIEEGEFVCFLGPSGCGKTTLLRLIAGLERQNEGRIFIKGEDVTNQPALKRDFGIVFQSYALFPNLTVKQNIAYGLHGRGLKRTKINFRVNSLLEMIGLADQGDKYPAKLSGGQQQRVALARALATNPSLLLLDEPLSALDARVRTHLRKEMKELQHNIGVTTIMVTHDQHEALTMSDRIVVMRDGQIEQIGTPHDIYASPVNSFVADFIGEMNFIPAEIIAENKVRIGKSMITTDTSKVDNRNIVLAIRPEDIIVGNVGSYEQNSIIGRIDDSEFFGSFVRARLSGGDLDCSSILADIFGVSKYQQSFAHGDMISMHLPFEKLRIFEAA